MTETIRLQSNWVILDEARGVILFKLIEERGPRRYEQRNHIEIKGVPHGKDRKTLSGTDNFDTQWVACSNCCTSACKQFILLRRILRMRSIAGV